MFWASAWQNKNNNDRRRRRRLPGDVDVNVDAPFKRRSRRDICLWRQVDDKWRQSALALASAKKRASKSTMNANIWQQENFCFQKYFYRLRA